MSKIRFLVFTEICNGARLEVIIHFGYEVIFKQPLAGVEELHDSLFGAFIYH